MALEDEALAWDGPTPRSLRYGDVYFSAVDGLAESRAVFLQGCDLPEAWRGRTRFTVGEIGFGTGLNILALMDLWRREGPRGGRLHIFSIEAHPLSAEDAARALSAWPELAEPAAALLAAWPERRPGFQRLELPGRNVVLDLAVMEAAEALAAWDGRADAWFLDGFSPASNPAAWRDEVLALVAARSAPGARAATFTVAGAVRRGLAAAGFAVDKRPGFGRKRERLEARLPGEPVPDRPPQAVGVVGAGIAGVALARALRAAGAEVKLFDARGTGAGASGAPAGLVNPRLDAGGGPAARLHVQAFQRARDLYRAAAPAAVLAEGVVQIEGQARDAARFDRVAGWDGFAPGAVERLAPAAVAAALGEPEGAGGLRLTDALVVAPARLLSALLDGVEPVRAEVAGVEPADGRWRLRDASGAVIAEVDTVCLAAGWATAALAPDLPLRPVRGQVSLAQAPPRGGAAAWGGYVAPTPEGGLLFGATHDRDDTGAEVREADHARNLALLARARPRLAADLEGVALSGWAGVRAATPDHLPLTGELAPGLYCLTGLGGRGLTLAPLLAEHVAARIVGAASPLARDLQAAVDPRR